MKKGFTLVELLVVIAILAVLATAVVVVLNPAELLKQGRDSTRFSDLASINSAIALYLSQATDPVLWDATTCAATGNARCTVATTTNPFSAVTAQNGCGSGSAWATTTVDGAGWVAVDMASLTGGSPLPRLPLDPTNSGNYFYGYGCAATSSNSLSYEMIANLESAKYVTQETSDGGNNAGLYEVGNQPSL